MKHDTTNSNRSNSRAARNHLQLVESNAFAIDTPHFKDQGETPAKLLQSISADIKIMLALLDAQ